MIDREHEDAKRGMSSPYDFLPNLEKPARYFSKLINITRYL